jgi:nitrate/nitrite transporter NarK
MVCICESSLAALWAMPTEILSESAAAAGVGMINAIGSVAGFAGPYAFGYLNTRMGTFSYGWALMMVSAFAGGMLILRAPGARQRVSPEPPGP